MKKEYSSPQFLFVEVELKCALMSSPENYSSYIDPTPGDWEDPPVIDPDDDPIEW